MRVRQQPAAEIRLTVVAAPDLRPTQIETLVGGESVNDRRRLPAERGDLGIVRCRKTGKVRDILAHRKLPDDVEPWQRFIGIIFGLELVEP